jgi:hypothetical protein
MQGAEEGRPIAMSRFLMAARTLDMSRSTSVSPLEPVSIFEQMRFKIGQESHRARQERCVQILIALALDLLSAIKSS